MTTTGMCGRRLLISSSLADADDRVVINGLMRVRPGQKVTPEEQQTTP